MEKRTGIAAVGDICVNVYEQMGKAFPGGNPVNVAVYTRRLGGTASYTGVVGTDAYGTMICTALEEKGVDISHVKVASGHTAITHVEMKQGERCLGAYEEGVMADFHLTAEDLAFLGSHELVVSGIWGRMAHKLRKIKSYGAEIAFDFADKFESPLIDVAIPYVDYAFFSYEGSDESGMKEYMRYMQQKGPKVVTITRGAKGSIAYDGNTFTTCGIVPCEVVDTMGAGDSFIAGFLHGILQKKSILECMQMGAKSSSITLGYQGAW